MIQIQLGRELVAASIWIEGVCQSAGLVPAGLARISHNVSQLRPCDATKPSLLNDLPECARNSVFNSLFVRIPSVKSLIQRVLSWQERAGPIGDEISGLTHNRG